MTLELCLEMNQKLQAVLEDTLLKNITLKVCSANIYIHSWPQISELQRILCPPVIIQLPRCAYLFSERLLNDIIRRVDICWASLYNCLHDIHIAPSLLPCFLVYQLAFLCFLIMFFFQENMNTLGTEIAKISMQKHWQIKAFLFSCVKIKDMTKYCFCTKHLGKESVGIFMKLLYR